MGAVTGVASFEYDHSQTGVAPNDDRAAPVFRFRCFSD
jgi:hypothetical protein